MRGGWDLQAPRPQRLLLGLLAAIALAASLPSFASAAIYWGSDRDGLGAANLDGTQPQWNYLYDYTQGTQGPSCGVAVNSEFLYWAAPGGIARRRLEGDGLNPGLIVPGLSGPCGLALNQSRVYWANLGGHPPLTPGAGSIGRANLDGSEATNALVTGLERPCGVAVAGDHVYWFEEGGIGRANLDGSQPVRPYISLPWARGCGLAAAEGHLYWSQSDSIARSNLDGGDLQTAFVPGIGAVAGIAVDSNYIYWDGWLGNSTATIGRAKIDGADPEPAWLSSSALEPFGGIAVDSRPTPPYLTLPSRSIRFRERIKYNARSGAALLGVYVPPHGPAALPSPPDGQLTVTSPGLSWRVLQSTTLLPAQGGFALWQLRIRPGAGRVGKRIRRQLRRRGRAPVNLRVQYTQERVYPVSQTRRVILRRRPSSAKG